MNNINGPGKTSGLQSRNKKAAFQGKKNKTVRKSLNFFKNKRSKRRAQIMTPFNQLHNMIEDAAVNMAPYGNETEIEFEMQKQWALNYLVGAIKDARSLSHFEEELEKPLDAGWKYQPPEMQYMNLNYPYDDMSFNGSPVKRHISDDRPLKYYFDPRLKLTLNMGLYDIPKYSQYFKSSNMPIPEPELYNRKPVDIPLIDIPSNSNSITVRYYDRRYDHNVSDSYKITLTPLLAAILNKSSDNLAILQKVLDMEVSVDELDLRFLFYMNRNTSVFTQIDFKLLNEVGSRFNDLSNDIISYFITQLNVYTIRWIKLLLNYKNVMRKERTDAIYRKLFEILSATGAVDEIVEVIMWLQSLNIKLPIDLIEDQFTYYSTATDLAEFEDTHEPLNKILAFLIPLININKNLDYEGNNMLMLLLKAPFDVNPALIEMVISKPDFDPNHKNSAGETALAIAIKSGRSEIAKRLMRIPGANLEAKNIYGRRIINQLRTGMAPNATGSVAPAAIAVNQWNNEWNNRVIGRTTRRNNYRNMRRTYEQAIRPRIAMTMSAKEVGPWGKRRPIGPNLGRHIASFVPSAVAANN